MPEVTLLSAFLLGLFGGVHCAGMCGGIVSVLGATAARRVPSGPVLAIPVVQAHPPRPLAPLLGYNAGRVTSYTLLGALAGALGSSATLAGSVLPLQQTLFAATNLLLIGIGVHMTGAFAALSVLEPAGSALWRAIRPLATRLLHARGPRASFAAGLAWGLVPCGMVYGVLIAALLAGSAAQGAMLMLALGLGTLPNLLALGWLGSKVSVWLSQRWLRIGAGLLIIGFGLAGFARLDPGAHLHRIADACLTLFR